MAEKHPNKAIESAEELWRLACQYFEERDNETEVVNELIRGGHLGGQTIEVPNEKAYTWEGFNVFLRSRNVINNLKDYRDNKEGRYESFQSVLRDIESVMDDALLTGGLSRKWDSGIVTRKLRLTDKKEVSIPEIPIFSLTDEESTQPQSQEESIEDLPDAAEPVWEY